MVKYFCDLCGQQVFYEKYSQWVTEDLAISASVREKSSEEGEYVHQPIKLVCIDCVIKALETFRPNSNNIFGGQQ